MDDDDDDNDGNGNGNDGDGDGIGQKMTLFLLPSFRFNGTVHD